MLCQHLDIGDALPQRWQHQSECVEAVIQIFTEGATADLAIFSIANGQFGYLDYTTARFDATQRVTCELTVRDGKIVWDLNGIAGQDWRTYYNVR
jgi:dihydroorotase